MFKQILIIVIITSCLLSCRTSSIYFENDLPSCSSYYNIEKDAEMIFLKKKEIRAFSKFLKNKYGSATITHLVYFKSNKTENVYYCEFSTKEGIVYCLLLDDNKRIINEEENWYDY